jgi:phenylalanyl-tRNA synthetase beta subunit
MFDRFEKEGRVSYGFRIVFQSHEKTLEGAEADTYMEAVYKTLRERGCEVR